MTGEGYMLVWTRTVNGEVYETAAGPTSREEALAGFDNLPEIQRACSRGQGRLRVLREQDFRPAAAGALVELDRHITGCARRFPKSARCPLPAGHDGTCMPVGPS